MAPLQETSQAVSQWFKGQSRASKIAIAGALVAVAAIIVVLSLFLGSKEMVPLFSDLDAAEAGAILERLEEDGISYSLANQGATILVPGDLVYKLRLELASEGIAAGSVVGFEAFNEASFGSTDFDRKVKYLWALQGELTRTLKQITEVEDVRVHLVIPEPSVFLRDRKEPSASILLKLKPTSTLSDWQVQGIAHLVASSVEGLTPQNVTILDAAGNTLNWKDDATGSYISGRTLMTQLEMTREYEAQLEQKVCSLLEQVFGFGNVAARVSVDMSFDYKELTSEVFEPGEPQGLIRSEVVSEEFFNGSGDKPGGVSGTSGNIPTYESVDRTTPGNYGRKESTRNYELNKRIEKHVVAPGTVNQVSAAIWVDGTLTPQLEEQVRSTAAAVLGLDPVGDAGLLAVHATAFAPKWYEEQVVASDSTPATGFPLVAWIVAGVSALAFLTTLVLFLRHRKRSKKQLISVSAHKEAVLQAAPTSETPDPDQVQKEETVKEILRTLHDDPSQVVESLRSWLAEDR